MLVRTVLALVVTTLGVVAVVRVEPPEAPFGLASSHTWKLILDDSFKGHALDRHVWRRYGVGSDWAGHDGHGLRVARAVRVKGGKAVITARERNGVIESGAFTVRPRYYTEYGRIRARIRVDAGGSDVMSAVALTWPVSNDRGDGELDFYETGRQRETIRSYVHPGGELATQDCVHPVRPTRWHDVSMTWAPRRIHFQVDGRTGCTFTRPNLIPGALHRLTFQYDAFADHLGSTVSRMEIARVKVWRRAG
jgi:beta-glucanase (GH16 family)